MYNVTNFKTIFLNFFCEQFTIKSILDKFLLARSDLKINFIKERMSRDIVSLVFPTSLIHSFNSKKLYYRKSSFFNIHFSYFHNLKQLTLILYCEHILPRFLARLRIFLYRYTPAPALTLHPAITPFQNAHLSFLRLYHNITYR